VNILRKLPQYFKIYFIKQKKMNGRGRKKREKMCEKFNFFKFKTKKMAPKVVHIND